MHGCSNVADLNTGVSLHSSPVLMETARYFGGDFAICSKHFKCLALGVQCRFLDIGTPARVDSQNMERYWRRKNNFGKSGRKSKRTKSKSSENGRKQQVSHLKLELNTANNRNKTDNVLENIKRERKIYSRLIYIHELSSITKEIIKQDESVF